jgi:integrase
MARVPKFGIRNTPRGWVVNTPAALSAAGKRERSYFPSRDQARQHAARLREAFLQYGGNASAIRPALADAAIAAEKLLEPLGIGLLEAVKRFVEAEKTARASVSVEKACEAFRTSGKRWSGSQATAYRLRCEKLSQAFRGRLISTIGGEELRRHLEVTTGGPGAFNQALRLVRAIWRWSAKPPRKWCGGEAVDHIEPQPVTSDEIGVLSYKQAASLMRAAEEHFPDTVPAFAIALFTGMRQAEIERLEPGDISTDGITVPAVSAKTKRRRFIQMPAPLVAWLEGYPIGDRVCPSNWRRKEKAVRRLAGWKVWSDLVPEPEPPENAPPWPGNALRHTAASVAVALGKPIEQLVFEHGHSGGLVMLRRHYLGVMTKAEAVKISSIGPHGKKLPIIEA